MNYKTLRERILSNPQVQKEHDKNRLSFEVAQMAIEARIAKKMSQKELAKRVGTKQPSIARIESGNSLPSLRLLKKIANALGTEIRVKFSKDEQDPSLGIPYYIFEFDDPDGKKLRSFNKSFEVAENYQRIRTQIRVANLQVFQSGIHSIRIRIKEGEQKRESQVVAELPLEIKFAFPVEEMKNSKSG